MAANGCCGLNPPHVRPIPPFRLHPDGGFLFGGMVDAGNETHYNMGTTTAHPMDDVIAAFNGYRNSKTEDEWFDLMEADPRLGALLDALTDLADD